MRLESKIFQLTGVRTAEFVEKRLRSRVDQILDLINKLTPAKAFELNERLPVKNQEIEEMVDLRDPEGRRLSTDKKGRKGDEKVAKEMLKMRVMLGKRSDRDLDAWEAAIRAAKQ